MATVPLPAEPAPSTLPAPPAAPAALPAAPPISSSDEQRFVFLDADWRLYEAISNGLGHRHIRCTYDRGRLEIMTVSLNHERASKLLGRLVEMLTLELRLPLLSGGSTTFRREDLDRGLEPDQCYFIKSAHLLRGKKEIDLTIDPPPDLAIEIDISRSSLNRLGIYAALGLPEAWVYDGETLTILLLDSPGQYQRRETSSLFPFLPIKEVASFLNRRAEFDENELVLVFQTWVRDQIAHNWQKPA